MNARTLNQMSPSMKRLITGYADRGWSDANESSSRADSRPQSAFRPQSAYLAIASGMRILPVSEVQMTTRCHRVFRGSHLVVGTEASRRFDLLDLKVGFRSQFRREESLALRTCVDEAAPELIQWPLRICGVGGEIVVRAIIPARETHGDDDAGEVFEMLVLGELGVIP
jgi:hypothetical protein